MSARTKRWRKALKPHRLLLVCAALASAAVLASAWRWGSVAMSVASAPAADSDEILVVRIPPNDRARIRTWTDFFRCYNLTTTDEDDLIIRTMRRWATRPSSQGSIAFSSERPVEVVLRSKDRALIEAGDPFYGDIKAVVEAVKKGQCGSGGVK